MCDIPSTLAKYQDDHKMKEIARSMGIPYSSLARILNPYDHYDLGLRKFIPFLEATKDLTILDLIESHFGRVAIQVNHANSTDYQRFARECGEALVEAGRALEDGKIDRSEAASLRKELTELCEVAMTLIRKCNEAEVK